MGLDPSEADRAGTLLREELERTSDLGARQAWERVRALLLEEHTSESPSGSSSNNSD